MLPKMNKNETPKKYAYRLLKIAEYKARIKANIESKIFLDKWIRKGSMLRQLFDNEINK